MVSVKILWAVREALSKNQLDDMQSLVKFYKPKLCIRNRYEHRRFNKTDTFTIEA